MTRVRVRIPISRGMVRRRILPHGPAVRDSIGSPLLYARRQWTRSQWLCGTIPRGRLLVTRWGGKVQHKPRACRRIATDRIDAGRVSPTVQRPVESPRPEREMQAFRRWHGLCGAVLPFILALMPSDCWAFESGWCTERIAVHLRAVAALIGPPYRAEAALAAASSA